jgi:hypothetical protein
VELAPVVCVDESGNSGQNLLDPNQPVFVLAAVHLEESDARRLADELAGDAGEAHYTRLRKKPAGQTRLVEALTDDALQPTSVRVSAIHKPFMAVAKFVDLLVEPMVAAEGVDLYERGFHLKFTHVLQDLGELACPKHWRPLIASFVRFIWRGTTEDAVEVVRLLHLAIQEAGDHPVADILVMAPLDPRVLLDWHGRGDTEESADALDPAVTSVFEQTVWWGDRLGPFLLKYDDSKVVERWTQRLIAMSDPAAAAAHSVTPSHPMPVLPLAGLAPSKSHDTPAVQIADVLAGACADVLRGRVLAGDGTDWQLALREARVLRFVDHMTWPHDEGVAEELKLQGLGESG